MAEAPKTSDLPLAHMVYFTLNSDSAEASQELVEACKKHLSNHAGVLHFSAGVRGPEFNRNVNVQDFHVALNLVFKTKADHDRYQVSERHQEFVKFIKGKVKQVRVFDSYLHVVGK